MVGAKCNWGSWAPLKCKIFYMASIAASSLDSRQEKEAWSADGNFALLPMPTGGGHG